MKVSGKEIAERILQKMAEEIKKHKLTPGLAIFLAGPDPASRIYVTNKVKAAERVSVNAQVYEFSEDQEGACLSQLKQLSLDSEVNGIIVQQPMFDGWDVQGFLHAVGAGKDVDGFLDDSPYTPATAAGCMEMLGEFASLEGFASVWEFLKGKKIAVLGKGKTAGGPIRKILLKKNMDLVLIDSKTEDRDGAIRSADVVIAATGRKHIVNGSNIKEGAYVIGIGVGKDENGIYGDINEAEISQKAKLFCPTIGGIGPLTIACLLRNVVQAARNGNN